MNCIAIFNNLLPCVWARPSNGNLIQVKNSVELPIIIVISIIIGLDFTSSCTNSNNINFNIIKINIIKSLIRKITIITIILITIMIIVGTYN